MSHDNELGIVRRLDAAHLVAKRTNDPGAWALYWRLKAQADRFFATPVKPQRIGAWRDDRD